MQSDNTQRELVPVEVYSCYKCGALLFRKDQIVKHVPFQQNIPFEKKKREKHPSHGCLSIFIKECPKWVKHQDQIEAKIYCPGCYTRLGMLHWQGTQCSYILSGTWVNPAIQFPISKVDYKVVKLPVPVKPKESNQETKEMDKPKEPTDESNPNKEVVAS